MIPGNTFLPSLGPVDTSLQPEALEARVKYWIARLPCNTDPTFQLYLRDISRVWDPEDFKIPGRRPVTLGPPQQVVSTDWDFKPSQVIPTSSQNICTAGVLNMPIKYPGSPVMLPRCLHPIKDLVKDVLAIELALKRKYLPQLYDRYWCYITVDTRIVPPGEKQRNGGLHVDGFQGQRYVTKLPNDHSFLYTSDMPTWFTDEAYNPPPNYNINWFEGPGSFTEMITSQFAGPIQELCMISGLQIHEAGHNPTLKPRPRFFFRAEFVLKHYDRLGDTINPLLGQFEHYVDRSIQSTLPVDASQSQGGHFGAVKENCSGEPPDLPRPPVTHPE
uniref:Uncharacterized protein n=1 Tax=viral metagenome TaxID=1070528 RepID=A0A6C0BPI9_9ZZZZ